MTSPVRPARLAVGVVGAGRVGTTLAQALQRAGHDVIGISGVSAQSQRRRAQRLPDVPLLPAEEVVRAADLALLCVPDDALPHVIDALRAQSCFRAGQLVAHTSGAHGLEVLQPAADEGALPLCLHPVMTFAGGPEDLDRLGGAPFGVTAPEALRPVAEALVLEMGGEPVAVPEEARVLYHAALAWGANYLVTLTTTAADLLRRAGVEDPKTLLEPLLRAGLENALDRGEDALTGPVSRGDAGTVAAHLAELRRKAPSVVPAYIALARLTADRALHSGRLDPAAAESLLDVLADNRAEVDG